MLNFIFGVVCLMTNYTKTSVNWLNDSAWKDKLSSKLDYDRAIFYLRFQYPYSLEMWINSSLDFLF